MKSRFLLMCVVMVAVAFVVLPSQNTAFANDEVSKAEVQDSLKEIQANIVKMRAAYKKGDRVTMGKLSNATRTSWYGLPWGIRAALEDHYPGTRGKMKTLLDGTARYAGGGAMSGEVRVLFHEGLTKRDGNVKTRNDKFTNEDGFLVRERDARTEKKGNKVEHEHTWKDGNGNTIRKNETTITKNGNTRHRETTITNGEGEKVREGRSKTTKTGDKNKKKVKTIKFAGERWAHIDATTTRNGQIWKTVGHYKNDSGRHLTFVALTKVNGQYTTREGIWYDDRGGIVAHVKAKKTKVNGKVTGDKVVSNGFGETVFTREYEHVKKGNTVYHYDERKGKNGNTRIYEGRSTKTGDGEVEHEGTVTRTRG